MNRKPGKEQEFFDTIYNHIGKATQGTKLSVVYNAVDRLAKAGFLPDDAAESVEEKIKSMNLVERKAARQRPLRS
jgi:Fe2+ or Zn2+ uptake regulation protein